MYRESILLELSIVDIVIDFLAEYYTICTSKVTNDCAEKSPRTTASNEVKCDCRERNEKRTLFFINQEHKMKVRQLQFQEQLQRELKEKELTTENKRLEQQQQEARREVEREQLCLVKLRKNKEV